MDNKIWSRPVIICKGLAWKILTCTVSISTKWKNCWFASQPWNHTVSVICHRCKSPCWGSCTLSQLPCATSTDTKVLLCQLGRGSILAPLFSQGGRTLASAVHKVERNIWKLKWGPTGISVVTWNQFVEPTWQMVSDCIYLQTLEV